jgi:hypothetical protein
VTCFGGVTVFLWKMKTKKTNQISADLLCLIHELTSLTRAKKEDKKEDWLPLAKKISRQIPLPPEGCYILAHAFSFNCSDEDFSIAELARHIHCPVTSLLNMVAFLEPLEDANWLEIETNHRAKNDNPTTRRYRLNPAVMENLLYRKPVNTPAPKIIGDVYDLLKEIKDLLDWRQKDKRMPSEMFKKAEALWAANAQIPLIKNWRQFNLTTPEYFAFGAIIWDFLMGSESTNLESLVNEMFDYSPEGVRFSQGILRERNELMKRNLVEMKSAVWSNHVELVLTDLTIEWLQEQDIHLTKKRVVARKDVLQPDQIAEKALFFDADLQQKLRLLEQTLSAENLSRIRERLQEKNMPEGISIIFYGPPGTGKTESVLQIARKTGRSVMWVDMGNTKSMFYGESEKKISAIFKNYQEFSEHCETLPILLFNEADALFSTRNKPSSSPVSQTENAIQNILLEKMEKFSGILMATTNLEGNLDPAFDRRFLYKLAFYEPDLPIRTKILRDKIPHLEEASAELLAGQFRFSGGMIENLARKCEMYEILNGGFPNSEELLQFAAEEESMRKKDHKPIGFMPAF